MHECMGGWVRRSEGMGEGEGVGGQEGLQVSVSSKKLILNDVNLAQPGVSLPSVKVQTFFLFTSLCARFRQVLDILCHMLHLLASLLGFPLQPLHVVLLLLQ